MASVNYKAEGTVFDIQRFSIHDGPGIRTIVFLKGCPLSCLWCCNPESQKLAPVVMFQQSQCISCGKCLRACKVGAISLDTPGLIDRQKCVGCGECASVCPTGALVLKGEKMTVEQVVQILKKDATIYRKSGGGITLSGGEPMVQWEFATELLKACKSQGWHTAIETTGYGSEQAVESVFPFIDLALLDIKSMNSQTHKNVTGVTNELIHKNAVRIAQLTKTVIRVPTIPTINAFDEEFLRIAEFAKTLQGVDTVHVLPYHTLGENKYNLLGKEYSMGYEIKPLPPEEAAKFQQIVQNQGLRCVVGG
ncbi:glycyl-radical enzyme activating protein [Clostridium minihomine]|uniref:glycyl-radical enzyme activating protein n=1 Tax=Clostridium minihomine TaxID=2045012 RepID=UPI000C75835D|nr:glycyl-radical enzyme activating protein [Clostridium minihomine]